MPLNHLTILGVGLLGGSIGLAAKSALSSCIISGYGHRRSTLDRALQIGAIDQAYDDPASSVRSAELVILCTPVGLFEEILTRIAPALPPGCIVTDVGSTKRSILTHAQTLLPKTVHFVGSHPMAGSEKRGVEFARPDLFQNALCLLTPAATPPTDPAALALVESFWQSLGMRTTRLSPDDHDRLLSDVSHLPHALAAALVSMQSDAALDLAGKGFLDTTRVAGGDGALWRDILLDNRDNLRQSLSSLQQQLSHLQSMLDSNNTEALRTWLDTAAKRREDLLGRKLREMNPD
jgi:prephenate dehydrogenase